ncbi:hypothetical protein DL96DRAFT_701335 [Flagelloscypha sp. PMI_526]|nr:hypothetical protein DL96DRAFT_701335 [Flagelloscypha sp. PMI_526]
METLRCPHCSGTLGFKDFVTTTAPHPFVPEELLQSNQLLAGLDSHSIRNNIEIAVHHLQSVKAVLAHIDLLRKDLEEARSQTQNHITRQRECIGIGRGLPLDVLRNIFELVTEFFPFEKDSEGGRRRAIVQLSSVSRTWRKISLDFSSMWSYITIPVAWTALVLADSVQLLNLFLTRSSDSPLRVSVHFPANGYDADIWTKYKRLYLLLTNHSNRWEELVLIDVPYELLDTLFPVSGASRLKRVKIEMANRGFLLPMSLSKSLILDTLALRSVCLATLEVKQFGPVTLPWSQLRKLELEFIGSPFRKILALLLDMPKLEELTLYQMGSNFVMNDPSNSAVKLTNLTQFNLNFADSFLLDALILPNLRYFILARFRQVLPSPSIEALGRFLARTGSLEVVTLSSPFHVLVFPGTHHIYRIVLDLVYNSPVAPEGSGVAALSYARLAAHFPRLEYLEVYCNEYGLEEEEDLDGLVDVAKALVAICQARNDADDKSVSTTFLAKISARFVVRSSPIVFEKLLEVRKEALEFPRFVCFQVLREQIANEVFQVTWVGGSRYVSFP